jgi:hypothetical protein
MTAPTRVHVLAFAGASLLPLASPLAAQAVTINVSGTDYEIFYTSTSYNANPDLFGAASPGRMPWWSNAGLASLFAAELYNQLGENVYLPGYGPVFAYGYNPVGSGEVYALAQNTLDLSDQLDLGSATPLAANVMHPYAYARANTPVPAPMPLFGAAAAFGWARRLRNNQKLITSINSINSKVCRMNQAVALADGAAGERCRPLDLQRH